MMRANWQADCPKCVASKFTCDDHHQPAPDLIENCERCGGTLGGMSTVMALESFGEFLCTDCFDNACEAAWERQQEDNASEPPVTLSEQHRAAWQQKQDLRS